MLEVIFQQRLTNYNLDKNVRRKYTHYDYNLSLQTIYYNLHELLLFQVM